MMNMSHEGGSRREVRPMQIALDDDRLSDALEAVPDGVAVFDENHRLVFANGSYRDFLGESVDGIHVGMAMADIVCRLADSGRIVKVDEARAGGMDATEWLLSDGRVIRFVVRPLAQGGRMCVGTDITKISSERLLRQTVPSAGSKPEPRPDMADWRALGAAADALDIGIVLLNATGEPELFNENYRSFLGMLEQTAQPAGTDELSATKPLAHSVRLWRGEANDNGPAEVRRAGDHTGNVQEGRTVDGRTIRYVLQPLTQGNLLCVGVDVTPQKRMEQDIARLQAEIKSARDAKSMFQASLSHELRTPLNAIIGFTQMMLHDERTPPTEKQRDYLDIVFRSSGHLLDLIVRILDLQKIEAGGIEVERAPVGVVEVVQESMDMLAPQAKVRGINMSGETVGNESAVILADPVRFRQVMENLLSNAIKYNRPGGHVWVTCSTDRGGWHRIAVRDTGDGIPHRRRGEVFKPFSRLGREAGRVAGTGIGLAISKDLIERMGGRIGFESEPGRGSTFWVEMPSASASASEQSVSPLSGGHPEREAKKEECVTAA